MAEFNYTSNNVEHEDSDSTSLILGKSYLYMALGLLISALVAFGTSFLFRQFLSEPDGTISNNAAVIYMVILVVSFIGCLIDAFVMRKVLAEGKHSAWAPYIIYCSLMGLFLSGFMIMGIPFYIMAQALAITAISFTAMFAIGAIFKGAHRVLSVTVGFLLGAVLVLLICFLVKVFTNQAQEAFLLNVLISAVILIISVLIAGIDGRHCREIIENECMEKNVALYCAFIMYGDFVIIFIRVLRVLILIYGNKK